MIRVILSALGVLILSAGGVWFLRGVGLLTDEPGAGRPWQIAAGLLVPAGIALVIWAARAERRGPMR